MSDVHNTTATAEAPVSDIIVSRKTEPMEDVVKSEPSTDSPAIESAKPEDTIASVKDESVPAEEKKDDTVAAEKPVEPISEGQLAVKAPGFIKSIIPAKREFWLSDDSVSSKDLSSYMRGEKAEISHDVVAWASQTGKGLLFFNKKGESKKQPSHVLALYDATELKKQTPHEISFKLNNEHHVLKATSDAERDGWYLTIERAIETGKALKDETRESEGYKAEKEKLNKPHVPVVAAAAAKPKKSMEADKADKSDVERKNSDIAEDDKKEKKNRSTSRGVFDRLKNKKEEKKEEKTEEKTETDEPKVEEEHHTEESAAGLVATGAAGAGMVAVNEGSHSEDKKEETTETSPLESKTEEKPKPSKRGSIFGKMQAGFGSLRSPQKEKSEQEAELKPEVPPKDEPVSDAPPQIPATNVEPAEEISAEDAKDEEAAPLSAEDKKDVTTPSKEKKNYLSGLSFMKRNRSVSPSANAQDTPVKTEEPAVAEAPKEAEPIEEAKADEATAETTAVEPLKPATGTEETSKKEKRESVLGSLGRRASKAFKGIQGTPRKENATPVAEAKNEETAVAEPAKEEPITNGEVKSEEETKPTIIGDVVPEAVNVGKPENQPPAVTASA